MEYKEISNQGSCSCLIKIIAIIGLVLSTCTSIILFIGLNKLNEEINLLRSKREQLIYKLYDLNQDDNIVLKSFFGSSYRTMDGLEAKRLKRDIHGTAIDGIPIKSETYTEAKRLNKTRNNKSYFRSRPISNRSSRNMNGASNEPDPATGLTPSEKSLVASSWALAAKDSIGTGVQLMIMLFQRKPEYKDYFSFRNTPNEDLPNSAALKAHAAKVMSSLSSIVDNLNNADVLIGLLKSIVTSHKQRMIPEEAFQIIKQVVLELLKTSLGSQITKEGLDAWDKTLTVAVKVIHDTYAAPSN